MYPVKTAARAAHCLADATVDVRVAADQVSDEMRETAVEETDVAADEVVREDPRPVEGMADPRRLRRSLMPRWTITGVRKRPTEPMHQLLLLPLRLGTIPI